MHHHLPPITAQEAALCRRLKSVAAQCGFVSFGVASAEPLASWRSEQFAQWLRRGQAAGMEYLHRQAEPRQTLQDFEALQIFRQDQALLQAR